MSSIVTSDEDLPSHNDDVPSRPQISSSSSLIIPITSSCHNNNYNASSQTGLYIEIFPEELPSIRPLTLAKVLSDECAPWKTWCEAARLYLKVKREKDGLELLERATDELGDGTEGADKLRVLASAGIAALARAHRLTSVTAVGLGRSREERSGWEGEVLKMEKVVREQKEEMCSFADAKFTKADTVNQVFAMTWIGRGMLQLAMNRMDQARFFFEELTMRECGEILPALLGMAAVKYREKKYATAQELYGKAILQYPKEAGSAVRVGFAMASYKLGQVDRAKAAFRRAHEMDPENVDALIGCAILEMASADKDVLNRREYRSKMEHFMKMISMANIVDHENAMVQNHLANHYFWKWSPVSGITVEMEKGSQIVKCSNAAIATTALEGGDRIRIGYNFETCVALEEDDEEITTTFRIQDSWKFTSASGLKVWKKDYERVLSLAKGAFSSTNIPEIQGESLYIMARVSHVRGDMEQANKFYNKACKYAPDFSPARFGLAQTLIWDEAYDEAAAHLRLLLGTCSNATDALAALGLLEVKAGKDRKEALVYLKKAIDLDPFKPDLVLIEALALQQHESDYLMSLDRYRKAVRLLEAQSKPVPADVLTNMGVLCHETKNYEEAFELYGRALKALDEMKKDEDHDDCELLVRHKDNCFFWSYESTDILVKLDENENRKLIVANSGVNLDSLGLKPGDDVSIEGGIETKVTDIVKGDDDCIQLIINNDVLIESNKKLSVKKSNGRLRNASSISVAFNLARLHEAAGRIIPAVELHKAIVKRHPSYVNSYLRLACIARDCGSLKDCSEWLKSAVAVAPGNPEVLTLVGNLHLSLCDWAPAQKVFDQLLTQKVPKVEAYSLLSLGNIYFNNLNAPKKYSKHLHYAADFYRKILSKDNANAYAANGLGTVLAERGELFKAKDVFNRVREVSGDTILDSLLNLGHIYLAQKKHPEALQMYQSYMNRTRSSGAPITSKSQDDDEAEVLLYIAFAYFDWARQTELFGNAKAAPADERYQKCVEYIETAMKRSKKENVILRYNWCMTKLQAANCVLQKVNRNIRRTAQEIKDALDGLEQSLLIVQTMLQWKSEGKKVAIPTGMLTDFSNQCKHNIDSAKSHLNEEIKKEKEAQVLRDFQRIEAEANEKQRLLALALEKEKEAQEIEEREKKARQKIAKVSNLMDKWKQEAIEVEKLSSKKSKAPGPTPPGGVDDEAGIFDTDVPVTSTSALFDESDDEEEDVEAGGDEFQITKVGQILQNGTEKDLFGDDSGSDFDEESTKKRPIDDSANKNDDEIDSKKRKISSDGDN